MNQNDQIQIVLDLTAAVGKDICQKIRDGKVPETWDGIFLRELFAEKARIMSYKGLKTREKKQYNNDVVNNNL